MGLFANVRIFLSDAGIVGYAPTTIIKKDLPQGSEYHSAQDPSGNEYQGSPIRRK